MTIREILYNAVQIISQLFYNLEGRKIQCA